MQEQQEQSVTTIDIRDVLRLLRAKLGLIILFTVIGAAIGTVYTFFLVTPTYTASTQLVAKLPDSDKSAAYAGQVQGNINMAGTISQVIVSPRILDQVQTSLKLPNSAFQSDVTATSTDSGIVTLTVNYNNPYTAQKIANETAKVFSDNAQNILNVTNVNVLAEAKVNKSPISPNPKVNIAVSTLVGLILGVGLVLLLKAFNNKISSESDIEVLGFTVLGSTAFAETRDFETLNTERGHHEVEKYSANNVKRTVVRSANGKKRRK